MAASQGRLSDRILKVFAILAVLGVVVAAVVVKGFEQGEVKLNTQNLWLLHKQKIDSSHYYGQVNTGLSELTSVNSVAKLPEAIFQSSFGAVLLGEKNVSMASINLSAPVDYAAESQEFVATLGSDSVSISESVVVFFNKAAGSVSYSKFEKGKASAPSAIRKPDALGDLGFSAASVSPAGVIQAVSAAAGRMFYFDTRNGEWSDSSDTLEIPGTGDFALTSVGDAWLLVDRESNQSWIRGSAAARSLGSKSNIKLQAPSSSGQFGYFSTDKSLFSVDMSNGDLKEIETDAGGMNSAPVIFEGNVYSAWLTANSGLLYNGSLGEILPLGGFGAGESLGGSQEPVIQSNGTAAVLNDAQSGWAWNLDGSVIPSSQDWKSKIIPPPPSSTGGEEAKKPEPPVANDDSFGARPDTLTNLPVLLNDTDPNPDDVLTIDPNSVTGWDSSKGTLRIAADGQSFSLLAKETVKGSASFSYRVTDGSQAKGLVSKNLASVTVSFVSGKSNSAPVWCSDAPTPCAERLDPSASVLPGQSVSVRFADGFIDPEGDKVFIVSTELVSGTGSVGFTSKGEVVFRSSLSNGAREVARVNVTVSDSFGATTTKPLSIKVDSATKLDFEPFVVSAVVGQTKVVDIRRGALGVNGQVNLLEVKSPASAEGLAVPIVSQTAFSITGTRAEQVQVSVKFTDDSGVPKTSFVQVNVFEDSQSDIAVSPVNVLVRAGLDSTVDLYTAISNPSERALIISDIEVIREPGAVLYAGKVKGGNLRVRGETETRAAGRIGLIKFRVSDGSSDNKFAAEGQIFVYQVAGATKAPVGVDDSITLRAESTGDLDALANDVGTPGIPLSLDAKNVSCEGTDFEQNQGIVFAAHGVLRIVAPRVKGIYNCTYFFYSSDSPTQKSSANFTVNVTSKSSNRAPIPVTVKARVTSYATIEIPIPLNGIDPDGDSVTITSVGLASAGKGYAAIGAKGNSVLFTVVPGEVGQDAFTYTVSDGNGQNGEAVGLVKVGIFANPSNEGPVTMVDLVNLVAGSDGYAKFDPTANDFDSAGKGLKLVPGSLKPKMKSGTAAYEKAAALVSEPEDPSKSRLVTIRASDQPSEIEYNYSVKDGFGSESLGTIIVRVTEKPVPDNPEVQDTIVDASQRAALGTNGIDVVSGKVTWLTGDATSLKLSIVGNNRGFRVVGSSTIVGNAPSSATFVVFKLSGKNYANQDAYTFGILHIPAESKVINLKDATKVWEVKEGEVGEQNLIDWVAILSGSSIEIDGENVATAPNGRPEGSCTFKSGTTVSYSAGNGGNKFNDVCIVPVRYVGEPTFTLIPLRIRIIADKPQPVFTNVTVEVMPGSKAELNLRNMVAWDSENPTFDWKVSKSSGSSILSTGPTSDLMTFEVVQGAESGQTDVFSVRIGNFESSGLITVVVGESPNAKPSATLTFNNASCDVKKGTCSLSVNDLTGVVNAFPEPLKFMPIGYGQGTPNYKDGDTLTCLGIKIKVTDANTVTANWDVKKGTPKSQACPTQDAPGALLDAEGKKGVLKVAVDLQGVPQAPLTVEQVDFSRSTITIRIKAGDDTLGENAVTSYIVKESGREVITCQREGDELVTTCQPIEDLRPYRGTGDKENLHTYSVTAVNRIGESAAKVSSGIYAYESLKRITADVIEGQTILGRETSTTMGVVRVTLTPRVDPLAAKYVVAGEGGTSVKTIPINGDFKPRVFEVSAKPGLATSITVRAEGAIPPPVKNGSVENSSTSWSGRVTGTPTLGKATASIVGDSAPYFGKMTLDNANRNYSNRVSKVAYVFWPGTSGPACTFDESTNTLTVGSVPGSIVKFAEDRAFNDQVVDLTSPDISGLQQNVSYRAKVCYSNGFKVIEAIAANTLSTIADPLDGDFEYTVALSSTTQATTGPLFSWLVKEAKKPAIPNGLKVQYSGDPTKPSEWKDSIYSTVFGAKPVIKVRYCNVAGTICSAGQTLVKPESDTKSWQLQIDRAYLATPDENATETTACVARPVDVNFGVTGIGTSGWIGGKSESIEAGAFKAEYQLKTSTGWVELDDSRTYFRIPRGVGEVSKIRFWFQPNTGTTKDLEKVQVTLNVTC